MAWNDPNGNDSDPWGKGRGNQGPPDLDEVVRKMQEKLRGLFGGRPGGPASSGDNKLIWGVAAVALVGLLAWEMVYRIEPAERGVVMRFGEHVATLQPGPHIRFPRPIEEVVKVNVERIQTVTSSSAMLTGDENIVNVELAVQYRIKDVKNYLFEIVDPDVSVQRVTESAIRDIIGGTTLSFVITEGRAEIASGAESSIQTILDDYQSGVDITSVNMQPAKPPEEVKAAFDDAIKAREDEQRTVNEAEAYRNEVVERMAGEAARTRLESEGYKEQVIAQAVGESKRFSLLLTEYEKAPEVTRRRLFLEAIEDVMADSTKVIMDNKSGSSLMYLPLDKILEQSNRSSGALRDSGAETRPFSPPPPDSQRERRSGISRGVR